MPSEPATAGDLGRGRTLATTCCLDVLRLDEDDGAKTMPSGCQNRGLPVLPWMWKFVALEIAMKKFPLRRPLPSY